MKSYTDIEQSKKLSEILPIESADMWWAERYAGKVMENGQYIVEEKPVYYLSFSKPSNDNYSQDAVNDIPCWSLAALLSILPKGEDKDIDFSVGGYKGDEYIPEWFCSYEQQEPVIIEICHAPNLVDACYEMIIKLYELKIL